MKRAWKSLASVMLAAAMVVTTVMAYLPSLEVLAAPIMKEMAHLKSGSGNADGRYGNFQRPAPLRIDPGGRDRTFCWREIMIVRKAWSCGKKVCRPAKVLIVTKKRHNSFYGILFCKSSCFQDIWFRFMINQERQGIPDTVGAYAGMIVLCGTTVSTRED